MSRPNRALMITDENKHGWRKWLFEEFRKGFASIGISGYDYNWSLLASSGV